MEKIVQYLLHQSLNVSFVIIMVYLVRWLLLRKTPKKYAFILWAVVAIRLVFPGVSSPVSIFHVLPVNQVETTTSNYVKRSVPKPEKNVEKVSQNKISNNENTVTSNDKQVKTTSKNTVSNHVWIKEKFHSCFQKINSFILIFETNPAFINIIGIVWLVGMVSFIFWNSINFWRMKKTTEFAVRFKDNVFECEEIGSAFVMGLFHPKIYIPFRTNQTEFQFILKHEQYHIARKDYLTNYVSCILLSVYWFHPLVWLSYKTMLKDMEMSCDEYVLRNSSSEDRAKYSEVLLSFATGKHISPTGMLSFGENATKERVSHILKFKKSEKWVGIFCVCIIVLVSAICLTNQSPQTSAQKNTEQQKQKKHHNSVKSPAPENEEQEYVYFSTEDGGDIGQLGEEGYYYSAKNNAKQEEKETIAYETTADLNHDGIKDLVQITCFSLSNQPDIEKEVSSNAQFHVKMYRGLQNGGYEKQARFISKSLNGSHAENGEIFLTTKDGKDYLLFGQMYEMQGSVTYAYGAIFIDDEKGIQIVDEYGDGFFIGNEDFTTHKGTKIMAQHLSKLKKKIAPWIQKSSILVVEDCSREYYFCCQTGKERSTTEYYNLFW